MKRSIAILAVLGALLVAWVASTGASGDDASGREYWVELDNAFGLIEGADVKVAGVRAGSIEAMELDREDFRARIKVSIEEDGFGSLRTDTECETRPQSLIGEYFVDCDPGKARTELEPGGTVPVEQTKSTVPVDLVNNILRRPYRERLSILLSEFGAGLAARGDDLDETIRRAVPALRETDRVLALLAEQRRTIRTLNEDADTVLKALADDRDEVVRFVREARDTAEITATRSTDLRRQFQRLPTFLAELQPTMRLLGQAADRQTPALAALDSESGRLKRLLDALGDFSLASRPAFRSLAAAAREGRPAVEQLRPQVRRLGRAAEPLSEASTNLAITLEDLDDPARAVEDDPRNPRGTGGYSGLEAILRYIYFQGQATNIFDGDGHMLKVSAFLDSSCAFYWDAARAKTDPDSDRCVAALGPRRPGINEPDPTATPQAATRGSDDDGEDRAAEPPAPAAPAPETPAAPAPSAPAPERSGGFLDDVLDGLIPENLLPPALREPLDALGGRLGGRGAAPGDEATQRTLLDFLLGG